MQVLRAENHKRMPWKNGGGETTEVAVSPDNAGLSDFDWRVSMARVDGDGPFSSFPGIDRTLAILEGAGIVLDVAGHEARQLTRETEPHAFPADIATSAKLIGGSVLDFNVMSRRGAIAHKVVRLRVAHSSAAGAARLVLCGTGSVELTVGGQRETLGPRDAALIERSDIVAMAPAPDSAFYLVEFSPA